MPGWHLLRARPRQQQVQRVPPCPILKPTAGFLHEGCTRPRQVARRRVACTYKAMTGARACSSCASGRLRQGCSLRVQNELHRSRMRRMHGASTCATHSGVYLSFGGALGRKLLWRGESSSISSTNLLLPFHGGECCQDPEKTGQRMAEKRRLPGLRSVACILW